LEILRFATPLLALLHFPVASVSNSNDVDSSYLSIEGFSVSPSCIGNTFGYSQWFGLLIFLLLFYLGSGITICTSTTSLLSLDWDCFHAITCLSGFSTKWSKWYVLMMVRAGPIKVFPSLPAFLCTTKISFYSFCANHNAQFTSPS
jgi:hypothetical protein